MTCSPVFTKLNLVKPVLEKGVGLKKQFAEKQIIALQLTLCVSNVIFVTHLEQGCDLDFYPSLGFDSPQVKDIESVPFTWWNYLIF